MTSSILSAGLGGGGAMYSPAISPLDPFFRVVACDMGGLYRTLDGGTNWEMLDTRQVQASTTVPLVARHAVSTR